MVGVGKLMQLVSNLPTMIAGAKAAFSSFGAVIGGISAPVVAVIAVVAALVAAFVHLWRTNEDFRNKITAIWEQIKQLTHQFKAVRCIAGEAAHRLRQHIVDASDAAFVQERLQAVADISLRAGDAEIIEYTRALPFGMQPDPRFIMCFLCFQTFALVVIIGTDTAVRSHTELLFLNGLRLNGSDCHSFPSLSVLYINSDLMIFQVISAISLRTAERMSPGSDRLICRIRQM